VTQDEYYQEEGRWKVYVEALVGRADEVEDNTHLEGQAMSIKVLGYFIGEMYEVPRRRQTNRPCPYRGR
jgi:hypothetical protein